MRTKENERCPLQMECERKCEFQGRELECDYRVLHKDFLDVWLRWLRAGSLRNEDGTPCIPKNRTKIEAKEGAA